MENEVWKAVVGYEGLYEVSNTGKVRSLYNARCRKYRIKELKPGTDSSGYLFVALHKDGERKQHLLHKLVMTAFVGPRPEGYEINHIDEDKTNNFIYIGEDGMVDLSRSNLEYCTRRENCNHGTRNQRVAAANTNGKRSIPVLEYGTFADLAWSRCWPSTNEAGRAGYTQTSVVACCNGKLKTHCKRKFRYVPVGKDADWSNWSIRDL